MEKVVKAIMPIAGLGTRFLPLSKALPKEIWPLLDKPIIQYVAEEALASGIKKIVFVVRPGKKMILDYFTDQKIPFETVWQNEQLGDGHAILQAKSKIKNEAAAVLFGDDVVASKIPCLAQMIKVFEKYQKPVIAIYRLPKKMVSSYGIVGAEKIAPRVYRIKKIVEKPTAKEAPSNLAIVGKYIITPEVFDYLAKAKPGFKGEIILAETFSKMLQEGKELLGYEFEGKWLECGNLEKWINSFLYLAKRK
ncbi:MAG: sugar phosphate nucleotidyltransferase [bacterium]